MYFLNCLSSEIFWGGGETGLGSAATIEASGSAGTGGKARIYKELHLLRNLDRFEILMDIQEY